MNISAVYKALACLAIFPFLGGQAVAAAFCTATVSQILSYDTGEVWIYGTGAGGTPYSGYQKICNLNGTAGISSVACAAWLSLVKQNQSATNIITQTYYPNLGACTDIPSTYPFPTILYNVK